jgi:RNA polymerase sigma-70 factor (ECF subfamily)
MSRPTIQDLVGDCLSDVYGYAYRLTGNQTDAEDLTQQTFLTAQQKLDQLREASAAGPWLRSIARRLFLADRRRKAPLVVGDLADEPGRPALEPLADFPIDRHALDWALAQLPAEQRLMVTRFYFEEASYREIAAECDVPLGTVMSRLARAKQRLRNLLLPSAAAKSQNACASDGTKWTNPMAPA